MTKPINQLIGGVILLSLLLSCGTTKSPPSIIQESPFGKSSVILDFSSTAIKGAGKEVPTTRKISVTLPVNYSEDQEYPVLYYLHGFSSTFFEGLRMERNILIWQEQNPDHPFIFVSMDGYGQLETQQSFYTNSSLTGYWEDYFLKEAIPLIDQNFATIPSAEGRFLTGFSMGGYGALELGLKYPEHFGTFVPISPGALTPEGLKGAFNNWDSNFVRQYSHTFALNKGRPHFTGTPEDQELIHLWNQGFGNWKEKIATYKTMPPPPQRIKLIVGEKDYYPWITEGTKYVAQQLQSRNIPHTLLVHDGGHTLSAGMFLRDVLDFIFLE